MALSPSDFASGAALMRRLDELAGDTDVAGTVTRLFLSPAHRLGVERVAGWMQALALDVQVDALGTVVGRREGARPGGPALLVGSHIDSVRDAGRYDGTLGVGVALGALARLAADGIALPYAVEVLAFGDEEGVRFPKTFTSSKAVAGRFEPEVLALKDRDGITYAQALAAFGGDAAGIAAIARRRENVLGYVEVHIEQGPVLEAEALPVGIVTAIAGTTRWRVEVTGFAGHAGTVPMALRRDALAGAAEMILGIERLAKRRAGVVATVGTIEARPGAVNVIAGGAAFSLDFRSVDDSRRERLGTAIRRLIEDVAARRGLAATIVPGYAEHAAPCHPAIAGGLAAAVARAGIRPLRLASGAGHDALSFAGFCPMGMLFVRCEGGVSHNPAEVVTAADVDVAIGVLADFLAKLDPDSLTDV